MQWEWINKSLSKDPSEGEKGGYTSTYPIPVPSWISVKSLGTENTTKHWIWLATLVSTAYFQSTQLVHPGPRKRSPRNLQPRITRMKNTLNRFQGGFYKIILPPPTALLSFRANHKTTWEQSHPEHNLVKLSHIHKKIMSKMWRELHTYPQTLFVTIPFRVYISGAPLQTMWGLKRSRSTSRIRHYENITRIRRTMPLRTLKIRSSRRKPPPHKQMLRSKTFLMPTI